MTPTPLEEPTDPAEDRSLRFLLSPRWILFHLLVLGGIVLMINLSLWQWHRLAERREFNELVEERRAEPTSAYRDVVPNGSTDDVAKSVEWRAVAVTGTYDPDTPILVVNRSQDGRAGANAVTPLVLEDGRILLVNRGFIGLDRVDDGVPTAPAGRVELAGRLRASETRRRGQISTTPADDSPSGALEIPRIDITELERLLDRDLEPVWLSVAADGSGRPLSRPADDASLAPVSEPELSEGPHLSYAIQWLIFTAAVIVGWVFAVRRSIRTRRSQ